MGEKILELLIGAFWDVGDTFFMVEAEALFEITVKLFQDFGCNFQKIKTHFLIFLVTFSTIKITLTLFNHVSFILMDIPRQLDYIKAPRCRHVLSIAKPLGWTCNSCLWSLQLLFYLYILWSCTHSHFYIALIFS